MLTKYTVAHWYDADTLTASPSQINFLIFVPLFTFISIAYLEITPRWAKRGKLSALFTPQKYPLTTSTASHPYAHFAIEAVLSVFYFAGFVALSVFLSKLLFCRGSVCAAARADAVFAAFSWVLWTGTTTLLGMEIFKGGLRAAQANEARQAAMMQKETA